jgi:AcrR family transcriptional regulator
VAGTTGLARSVEPTTGGSILGDPSRRSPADEREALLRALPRVVAEHDWVGTSPARVAREAGIEPQQFWDHYRSLEHLFVEVYDRMMERLTRTAIRSVASRTLRLGPEAWKDQLDAIMSGVLAFYSVEPELAKTCLVDVLDAGPAARARRDDALARFTSYVEGLRLTHGEPMPALAVEMIVLGTTELICNRVARGEADTLRELLPELRQLWEASVGEQPPAAANAAAI